MLEMLILLEYKRQSLRRKVLGTSGISCDSYLGFALFAVLVSVFAWPILPIVADLPLLAVIATILGFIFLFTIVLAPVGLFLL